MTFFSLSLSLTHLFTGFLRKDRKTRRHTVSTRWWRRCFDTVRREHAKRKCETTKKKKWTRKCKVGRALLITWLGNAPVRAPTCGSGMRATEARLIPRRLRLIIPDRLYAHAPVSLARAFFRHCFSRRERRRVKVLCPRATFFAYHRRSCTVHDRNGAFASWHGGTIGVFNSRFHGNTPSRAMLRTVHCVPNLNDVGNFDSV